MTLAFKRSATKMWLLAMAGIPLLVISLDVLTNRRITNWLREIIFRPEDTQIYEPRDVIWAWAMFVFAAFLVIWGLKELFAPTKVVECRDEGLALKINGPLQQPSVLPWEEIVDVSSASIDDEGISVPVLVVQVLSRRDLPTNPWNARWLDERQLGVVADDWSSDPAAVAVQIGDFAVDATRRTAAAARQSIWESRSEWGYTEEE